MTKNNEGIAEKTVSEQWRDQALVDNSYCCNYVKVTFIDSYGENNVNKLKDDDDDDVHVVQSSAGDRMTTEFGVPVGTCASMLTVS